MIVFIICILLFFKEVIKMEFLNVFIGFIISLIVSAIIIYVVTKLFGEEEGFGTALLTAFIGAIIYGLVYYIFGVGWIAALLGGIAWLIALGSLYKIGWLRSFFIAIGIWILAMIVNLIVPSVAGPL
jgi:hypothetical protein